ncbi:MAG: hypothetical protein ACOVNR_09325 [Chitinophagaceae bacterium]
MKNLLTPIIFSLVAFFASQNANATSFIVKTDARNVHDTVLLYLKRLALQPDILRAVVQQTDKETYLSLIGYNNLAGFLGSQSEVEVALVDGQTLKLTANYIADAKLTQEFPLRKYVKHCLLNAEQLKQLKSQPIKSMKLSAAGETVQLSIRNKSAQELMLTVSTVIQKQQVQLASTDY